MSKHLRVPILSEESEFPSILGYIEKLLAEQVVYFAGQHGFADADVYDAFLYAIAEKYPQAVQDDGMHVTIKKAKGETE